MVWATRADRQKVVAGVDFEWSDKSWTHNAFRVYELIFWRRYGIRAESKGYFTEGGVRYGKFKQYAISWEATVALFETAVRQMLTFRLPQISLEYVPLIQLQTPQGIVIQQLWVPYRFAIALDTSRSTGEETSDPTTYAYTCTGSNLVLILAGSMQRLTSTGWPAASAITYNSVAMDAQIAQGGMNIYTNRWMATYYLINPSTGSNTMSINWVNTIQNAFPLTASYSGVKQTGFPDSSSGFVTDSGTAGSFSPTTTVSASNCWLTANTDNDQWVPSISGNNGVNRANNASSIVYVDSNGTVSTGSQSFTLSGSPNAHWSYIAVSIAPVPASGPSNLKTYNTNAAANIKTIDTNAIANVKTLDTNV